MARWSAVTATTNGIFLRLGAFFCSVEELNEKLKAHLEWSNNKTMRTLGRKSPIQLLREKLGALVSPAP
ncbi:MAG: hypothetical protein L6V84_02655 [Oscillospiraceae bacterium]|nr:MAG: hypothetical protein L6V84_02655 [Oscillospiraceae bacterium]